MLLSRDKVYAFYGMYILFSAIYCFSQNQFVGQSFLNSQFMGHKLSTVIAYIALPVYSILYIVFIQLFLDARKVMKPVYKLIDITNKVLLIHIIIMCLFLLIGISKLFIIGHFIGNLVAWILIIVIFISSIKYKHQLLPFLYVGSLALSIGNIYYTISISGFYPYKGAVNEWLLLCFCILTEIAVFLYALSFREHQLSESLAASQQVNIQTLKEMTKLQTETEEEIKRELKTKIKIIEDKKKKELSTLFEKEINELKVKSLRSQINQQFLFNSLKTIKQLAIAKEWERTEAYFSNFTQLLRKLLEHSRADKITLSEELKAIKLYVDMEKERFQLPLIYELKIKKNINTEEIYIPPMLIQPFIENAIINGLLLQKDKLPFLQIFIQFINNELEIEIRDNGISRKESNISFQQLPGINTIDERINLQSKLKSNNAINLELFEIKNAKQEVLSTCVNLRLSI